MDKIRSPIRTKREILLHKKSQKVKGKMSPKRIILKNKIIDKSRKNQIFQDNLYIPE